MQDAQSPLIDSGLSQILLVCGNGWWVWRLEGLKNNLATLCNIRYRYANALIAT
jgi:hypothetical protein